MKLPRDRSEAFVLVDVGARSGTEKRWGDLGKHIFVMAFDVEEDLDQLSPQLDLDSGDRIEVLVRLRPPNSYRNPGVFDYL